MEGSPVPDCAGIHVSESYERLGGLELAMVARDVERGRANIGCCVHVRAALNKTPNDFNTTMLACTVERRKSHAISRRDVCACDKKGSRFVHGVAEMKSGVAQRHNR